MSAWLVPPIVLPVFVAVIVAAFAISRLFS
jgi:hypothetical protein